MVRHKLHCLRFALATKENKKQNILGVACHTHKATKSVILLSQLTNGVCISVQTEVNHYHRWHSTHPATCHWHPGQVGYPDTQQTFWPQTRAIAPTLKGPDVCVIILAAMRAHLVRDLSYRHACALHGSFASQF